MLIEIDDWEVPQAYCVNCKLPLCKHWRGRPCLSVEDEHERDVQNK